MVQIICRVCWTSGENLYFLKTHYLVNKDLPDKLGLFWVVSSESVNKWLLMSIIDVYCCQTIASLYCELLEVAISNLSVKCCPWHIQISMTTTIIHKYWDIWYEKWSEHYGKHISLLHFFKIYFPFNFLIWHHLLKP